MKELLSINETRELNPLFKINDHLDKLIMGLNLLMEIKKPRQIIT